MVFLLLCASSNTVLQCVAKTGPRMSSGGSNTGSPCPGRLGNADLGHTASSIPPVRPSPNRCHRTGTAVAGAGAPRSQAQGTLDPASDQLKTGEKWAGCSSAAWQGFGDTGHSWRWAQPQLRRGRWLLRQGAAPWDSARRRCAVTLGDFFSPAVTEWELWEHHQDQAAAATLGSTPCSSSQAEREPGRSVEEVMTLNY